MAECASIIGCVSMGAGVARVPQALLERFGLSAGVTRHDFSEFPPLQNRFVRHTESGSHSARDAFAALLTEHLGDAALQ